MELSLLLLAWFLALLSGIPGLLMPKTSAWGQRAAALTMTVSMLVGLAGIILGVLGSTSGSTVFPWPAVGNSLIGLDSLSRFFLFPVLLVGGLGSLYGLGYWPQKQHQDNGRKLSFFWGILVAGMMLLVMAKQALAFLMGWELMALAAFFLVSTEDEKKEARKAGYVYLVATHIGTLTLFALFVVWRLATGSYDLVPAGSSLSLGTANMLFLLALVGFGLKAGIIPFHFWLPAAHANSPTHVSAILSGVVLKMGIYGLVRMTGLLPDLPWFWGGLILALGAVSGLLGVVFAIAQHDLKRLLAYHSVENIGIILMGLGLAVLGRSTGHSEWVILGLAGCLLHVWNHSLFKSLLFFAAGSVVHQTHTREIDRLGGLLKTMPWTGLFFLIGAVAICGLPPLNGFVSELLVYLGLFGTLSKSGSEVLPVTLVVPVLAAVGTLAVACFVKVFSTVFLGNARHQATPVQESPLSLLLPMGILSALCVMIGVGSVFLVPLLDQLARWWNPVPATGIISLVDLSPLATVGAVSGVLLMIIASAVVGLTVKNRLRRALTWDCGYALPDSRMQYTASSFAQSIVKLFHWVLRPQEHSPKQGGPFPAGTSMDSHVNELILDRVLSPVQRGLDRGVAWFRRFQKGLAQLYITYILIALILMLVTLVPIREIWAQWVAP